MNKTVEKLRAHASATPSQWRENAEFRQANKSWLRYSQMIAMRMLDRMEEAGINQKTLAARMGCSPQYVSRLLKGCENLSLDTLTKIEDALQLQLVMIPECEAAV